MEKLIELLDQYRKQNPREFFGDDGSLVVLTGKDFIELNRLIIISKEYEFIKWLVDNDKIDFTALQGYWDRWEMGMGVFSNMYKSDIVILTLSIQDNPIEFLISILK